MDNELQLVRDYWDAHEMKFIRAGQPFPFERVNEKEVERLRGLGYLKTQKEIQAERNPEAARALTQVQQLEADLAQAQAKVTELQTKVTELEGQQGGDDSAVQTLQTQLQDAQQQRQEAVDALDAQKRLVVAAELERDEAQKSLAEYQTAVGDLLPEGLTAQARKALITQGYVGKTLISLLTDEQLVAVKGVAQTTVDDLRVWAPFAGVVPAGGGNAGADAPVDDPAAQQ
ncbi:hypothetical protein [Deinococcus sp. SL84]|uniref:hypothetical protein n=1 Tax=Deinococcus sp. SL84 TaxID=2994663 RepID=UPI002276FD7F|nr:hypothetical protein [Deinococcus sp. SL84]MCY1703641.1 hypothetical protein [Deinococcus sp. SL84]